MYNRGDMTNSTLGGLIKDYRMQKGISQLDIAFSLGWKETSRLSRIEQGKTEKPPRELIDKIIHAIGLEEEEKNTLLLTGGYLPTEEEIKRIREETRQILENWPYPATLSDFSWRAIAHNKHHSNIYGISADEVKMLERFTPRVLDIFFNFVPRKLSLEADSKNKLYWGEFLKMLIINFKYEQRHRTKEKWYIVHIKELMKNDLFREIWVETDIRDKLEGVIGKFIPTTSVFLGQDKDNLLNFYLFSTPVLKDPRFEIQFLVPKDAETFSIFSKGY